jgi:hypothetical protein
MPDAIASSDLGEQPAPKAAWNTPVLHRRDAVDAEKVAGAVDGIILPS